MKTLSTPTRHPLASRESVGRALGDWPIWLYRIGLGRLVGRRYAVVGSIGRRSGRPRRAAVMVLREDRGSGEIFLVAGTSATHWYRNISDRPATEIWWCGRRFEPEQRLLSSAEVVDLLTAIRREHPREAHVQAAFFGWPWPASDSQVADFGARLGGVAMRPRRRVIPNGGRTGAASRLQIAFCEEYPTATNLARASLIPFPAIVFLAAPTIEMYDAARRQLAAVNPGLGAGWWPVPAISRALSACCVPAEVDSLREALGRMAPGSLLLDLELPVWDRARLISGLRTIPQGRRAVDRVFSLALSRHEVWTAEWPPFLPRSLSASLRLCLPAAHRRIYMLYSSMLPPWWRRVLIRRMRRLLSSRRSGIGIGALATGVTGRERLLPPAAFARDLREASSLGTTTVLVYRLGGLEEAHVPALRAASVLDPGCGGRARSETGSGK
jgi:deazaflavin-dependent oxidoreductase (nitroreductase family)